MDDDAIFDEIDQEFDLLEDDLESNINNILKKKSLKWIFVGGKGGVGKTTCSSSIAILLANVRESVLIISTDPAHSLSDSFGQKFSKNPILVNGFDNLYAMEVDPNMDPEETTKELIGGDEGLLSMIKDMSASLPGIDEAMGFVNVMNIAQTMKFDAIVFDTAPTGHTLRLLSFPSIMEKGAGKLFSLKNKFSGLFGQLSSLLGGSSADDIEDKFSKWQNLIEDIHKQFQNPDLTTFICVCIPEFLSLYETERLVQELAKRDIDVSNILVNQVLYPKEGANCELCNARKRMQQKYIDQIEDLYEDFHIVKIPLQNEEVRGVEGLKNFSKFLIQ